MRLADHDTSKHMRLFSASAETTRNSKIVEPRLDRFVLINWEVKLKNMKLWEVQRPKYRLAAMAPVAEMYTMVMADKLLANIATERLCNGGRVPAASRYFISNNWTALRTLTRDDLKAGRALYCLREILLIEIHELTPMAQCEEIRSGANFAFLVIC